MRMAILLLTLNLGVNLETSCCQLWSVDAGAIMRNGPHIPKAYRK